MKKKLLIMVTAMLCSSAMAQYQLTPNGLVNVDNPDQNFIVLDFADKTQAQLYSSAYVLLSSMYVSPKDVLSVVEGNSITINGVSKGVIYRKKTMTSTIPTFDINYTITMLFKDGKIRINNPAINRMNISGSYSDTFLIACYGNLGVFNMKGKLMAEKTKTSIEEFFNQYINDIKQSIEKDETVDW